MNSITALLKDRGDWRTLALMSGVLTLWAWLLFGAEALPAWAICLLAIPLITLHSSLQHEFIHGHPFARQGINDLIAMVPLSPLVPYFRFKDTHLQHHTNSSLCDPYDDPESWYQMPEIWEKRSRLSQAIFNFNNTLAGRMLIGPAIGTFGFVKWETRHALAGEWHIAGKWALHGALSAIVLSFVHSFAAVPLWAYLVSCYFGMSLLMVRTYLEHQAHERMRGRSVIIESRGPFSLLFLNNNFHAVHHAYPGIAWYRLPRLFAGNRQRFLAMNDGYRYDNYGSIFRRYLFRRKEPVPYPLAKDGSGKPRE